MWGSVRRVWGGGCEGRVWGGMWGECGGRLGVWGECGGSVGVSMGEKNGGGKGVGGVRGGMGESRLEKKGVGSFQTKPNPNFQSSLNKLNKGVMFRLD